MASDPRSHAAASAAPGPSSPASGPTFGPDAGRIRAMFDEVAPRYDLANTVLSFGIHHLWRWRVVRWSGLGRGAHVLDCATGTGDLAIAFARRVGPEGRVVGTDFSPQMLAPAPAKARARGLAITFEQADVTRLPYPDASFDLASISFGIRNVDDPDQALRELARVVRPGGTVMVLEFGQPRFAPMRWLYNLYSQVLLPRIGGLVTGKGYAYRYLQDSSAQFPCGEAFAARMRATGMLVDVQWRALSLGIAYMYRARVA